MHLVPIGGLCNRLRVIVSYLAATGDRPLHVWWVPNAACPALFSQLFEPLPCVLHENEFPPGVGAKITCSIYPGLPVDSWIPTIDSVIRPLPHIQTRITNILEKLETPFTAVHIRRTDHNSNYAEDRLFVDFASRGAGKIYIAADNPMSVVTLRRALGDRVVHIGQYHGGGMRLTSVEDAVVDLWVAGRATTFKGTYYSSFSDWIDFLRRQWIPGCEASDLTKH